MVRRKFLPSAIFVFFASLSIALFQNCSGFDNSSTVMSSQSQNNDEDGTDSDNEPPIALFQEVPPTSTASKVATFKFSATDNLSVSPIMECRLDNGNWAPCNSPWTLTNLTIANHQFFIRAKDASGNLSGVLMHNWSVVSSNSGDLVDPVLQINSPLANSINTGVVVVTGVVSDNTAIRSVKLTVNNKLENIITANVQQFSLSFDSKLMLNGNNTISVIAEDLAGNTTVVNRTLIIMNTATFRQVMGLVLKPHCAGCHSKWNDLPDSHQKTLRWVKPFEPLASQLHDTLDKGRMPKSSGRLSQGLIDLVHDWIQGGALDN